MKKSMEGKQHRFLYDKLGLVRRATADLAMHPADPERRLYLRGLCDALHGTKDAKTALAIHTARQVILAVQA